MQKKSMEELETCVIKIVYPRAGTHVSDTVMSHQHLNRVSQTLTHLLVQPGVVQKSTCGTAGISMCQC